MGASKTAKNPLPYLRDLLMPGVRSMNGDFDLIVDGGRLVLSDGTICLDDGMCATGADQIESVTAALNQKREKVGSVPYSRNEPPIKGEV